jgi:Zn-dependent peptidase ImmA (M78 family)
LARVVNFAGRYARLEKLLFGNTKVAYSPSALSMNLSLAGDVIAQAEELAEAERTRFGISVGPILELGWLIEDQGIKIVPRRFPEDGPARGGFFFDSEVGPCILVDLADTVTQRDYVLAHQYGHFLADFDPYITTVCGHPDPALIEDPRELRAHIFALAFLMPRQDLETYRQALGIEPPNITAEFVRQLQVYFAVDYGRGLIELEDAAEYFDTDVEEARQVLEQFHYEDENVKSPARSRAARIDRNQDRTSPNPN